jgi:RNA polymerase sigma-70 factor (ECF subfamily)
MAQVGIACEPREINGQPGAIFRDRDGRVLHTLTLDVLDGRIQTLRAIINPDKLRHVGPVADAWAISEKFRRTP